MTFFSNCQRYIAKARFWSNYTKSCCVLRCRNAFRCALLPLAFVTFTDK